MQISLSADLHAALAAAARRDGMSEEDFVVAAITAKLQTPQSAQEIADNARWLAEGGAAGSLHPIADVRRQWESAEQPSDMPPRVQQSLP